VPVCRSARRTQYGPVKRVDIDVDAPVYGRMTGSIGLRTVQTGPVPLSMAKLSAVQICGGQIKLAPSRLSFHYLGQIAGRTGYVMLLLSRCFHTRGRDPGRTPWDSRILRNVKELVPPLLSVGPPQDLRARGLTT
jgi:hypothetical protein